MCRARMLFRGGFSAALRATLEGSVLHRTEEAPCQPRRAGGTTLTEVADPVEVQPRVHHVLDAQLLAARVG